MLTGRVLAVQALKRCVADGVVRTKVEIPTLNYQPASLDLRFGDTAYRLRASFLSHSGPVAKSLGDFMVEELDLRPGVVLQPEQPYLIPLRESVDLPDDIRGFVNPKSSAGRVDTLCRVLTDRSDTFDQVRAGYKGPLYVEIVSRTFPLLIRPDMTMVQLRLFCGDEPELTDVELLEVHEEVGLLTNVETQRMSRPSLDDGLGLSLDLVGDENGLVGYRAKHDTPVLDYASRNLQWQQYWEPVYREDEAPRLVLEPEAFYLLMSQEAITIPPDLAAEMVPYDVRSGEVRTHYAGFFDPGFGYHVSSKGALLKGRGSRATLEVRAHDVPFVVEQGQRVCWMVYSHMQERPDFLYGTEIASNYQDQIATLSKHFTRPVSQPPAQQLTLLNAL